MSWTDDPLTAELTKVKTIHIIELRNAIDDLSEGCVSYNSSYDSDKDATVDSSKNNTVDSTQYSGADSSQNSSADSTKDNSVDGTNWNTDYYANHGTHHNSWCSGNYTDRCIGY